MRRGLGPVALPWRAATVVLLCASAQVLASCARDGEASAPPTTRPTSSSTPTTALDPTQRAVIEAYSSFRRCFEAATNPMNPEHPCLGETATGDELRTLTGRILERKAAGEIFKGTVETAPAGVSVTGDRATLRDCLFDRMGVYDAGQPDRLKEAMDTHRVEETVTMALIDGRWKVAAVNGDGEACEAAP